jgi:hypothetical protein
MHERDGKTACMVLLAWVHEAYVRTLVRYELFLHGSWFSLYLHSYQVDSVPRDIVGEFDFRAWNYVDLSSE